MSDPLKSFFEDPAAYDLPTAPQKHDLLLLLRHDINICMRTCQDRRHRALFAATMLIFAGIDLLGKFLAGDDSLEPGEPRKRFKKFFEKYFQTVSQNDSEIIYQLRNALMHSFGLYSKNPRTNQEYYFDLKYAQTEGPLIRDQGNSRYWMDIRTLLNLFEAAITKYQADLRQDRSLRNNFDAMYPRYGQIWHGQEVVPPPQTRSSDYDL